MGNINDHALPKLKILIPDATDTDAELLELFVVAVPQVARRMSITITLTITDSSYTISPDYADADDMWIVIAQRAVVQYRENELVAFRKQLGGMDTIANEVQRMSRSTTMREMREALKDAKAEFEAMVWQYKAGITTSTSIDVIGFRESS